MKKYVDPLCDVHFFTTTDIMQGSDESTLMKLNYDSSNGVGMGDNFGTWLPNS